MNLSPKKWPKRLASCKVCGRVDIAARPDGVLLTGGLPFHYAPCGRPCAGSKKMILTSEDRADGIHDRECEFCKEKEGK